jgi:isocitrate dehydrogenase
LSQEFQPVAEAMTSQEAKIIAELNEVQGSPVDIGGYYFADPQAAEKAMRPSATLNAIIG